MDNKKLLLAGAVLVSLSPLAAVQVQAKTATVNARARVLDPIQATTTQTLDFGTFSVTGAGSVDITDGGTVTPGGAITMAGIATPNQALLQIKASKGFALLVDATNGPGTLIKLGAGGAGNEMTITAVDLQGETVPANDTALFTIAGGPGGLGTLTLGIGATLNVNAVQNPGLYAGSFTVSVNYN